jgi:hypothetical protein
MGFDGDTMGSTLQYSNMAMDPWKWRYEWENHPYITDCPSHV